MNRTSSIALGLFLLAVGVALLVYRTQGGADLGEPMPVVITILAVVALLGAFGTLGKAFKRGV